MSESYLDEDASGAPREAALARDLIALLLPEADAALLVAALLAERAAPPEEDAPAAPSDPVLEPAACELQRVRLTIAIGDAARAAQHALNNPLTALLAEAQLLEMEPLAAEHRDAVRRMLALARRMVAATRRLDAVGATTIG
jgi:signal transduction histidine kinase